MARLPLSSARRCAAVLAALLVTFSATTIGRAQPPTVDTLLLRLFDVNVTEPYELNADFSGVLEVTVKRSRFVVSADGSFLEWRGTDGIRHRQVMVHNLNLPLLLRPFATSIRNVIADKIETQAENPETFHAHDIFLLTEQPDGRFVLAGIHRAIVDDAIDRYGHAEDKLDVMTRRKIAEWLYTAPTMKEFIARPGPPYALRAVIDENGVLYELVLSYDWGERSAPGSNISGSAGSRCGARCRRTRSATWRGWVASPGSSSCGSPITASIANAPNGRWNVETLEC